MPFTGDVIANLCVGGWLSYTVDLIENRTGKQEEKNVLKKAT